SQTAAKSLRRSQSAERLRFLFGSYSSEFSPGKHRDSRSARPCHTRSGIPRGCSSLLCGLQRSHVDRETVFHIRLQQSVVSLVDFLDWNDLHIGGDIVFAAEIEHLLRLSNAANRRARKTLAPEEQ